VSDSPEMTRRRSGHPNQTSNRADYLPFTTLVT